MHAYLDAPTQDRIIDAVRRALEGRLAANEQSLMRQTMSGFSLRDHLPSLSQPTKIQSGSGETADTVRSFDTPLPSVALLDVQKLSLARNSV